MIKCSIASSKTHFVYFVNDEFMIPKKRLSQKINFCLPVARVTKMAEIINNISFLVFRPQKRFNMTTELYKKRGVKTL